MVKQNKRISLTLTQKQAIINSWKERIGTQKDLANIYGVDQSTISKVFSEKRKDNYDDYSKNEEIQSLESRLGLSYSKSIIAIEKTDLYEQPSLENFINEYLSDGYEEEMDTEEFKELPTISVKLAENAIETLETFLMQHKNTPREHYFKLYELKRFIEYENRKDAVQTKITMYFK